MNELETFLINLNLIQTTDNQNETSLSSDGYNKKEINEKIADYILNSVIGKDESKGGWQILKAIYENKLLLNEIFGEKLINLLINTCAQLVSNLPVESNYSLSKHSFQTKNSFQLYLNIFDDIFDDEEEIHTLNESNSIEDESIDRQNFENFKYSIKLSNKNGTLFDLIIICLNLFIKFNDGTNHSIFNHSDNNKLLVLNKLCETLFSNINDNHNNLNLLRIIYLKFLNKLFKLNLKNLNKKTYSAKISNTQTASMNFSPQSSIASRQTSNHLFIEQFKIISQNNFKNNLDLSVYFVKMIINYLYNFAKVFKFITDSSLFKSNYYSSTNMFSFECLTQLLNETYKYLFDNIVQLDEELVIVKNDQHDSDLFDFQKYKTNSRYWKRLQIILTEMKSFKNNYQHAQICLRSKHSHFSCKINLHEIENRHDDITLVQKSCLFTKITSILFKNIISQQSLFTSTDNCVLKLIYKIKSNRLIQIINKFGICTCINLEDLISMQQFQSESERYFFNQNLCSIILDYLLSVSNFSSKLSLNSSSDKIAQITSSSSSTKITKRRSIFFPLMVDESITDTDKIINRDLANFASNILLESSDNNDKDLFKQFYDIIIKFDEKSILIVKYLIYSLNKYTKYLPHLLINNEKLDNKLANDDLDVNLSVKYQWIIHEIFYLFTNILDYLEENNEKYQKSERVINIFEMICKYMGEFLILSYSNTNNKLHQVSIKADNSVSNKSSVTSTPNQTEKSNSSNKLTSSSTFHGRTSQLNDNSYTNKFIQESASNQQIELETNTKFIEFMKKNSIKIYDRVSNLCIKQNKSPSLSISLCSQLIFFKNSQQEKLNFNNKQQTSLDLNIEQHLSKCLIDSVNSNLYLLNSINILDILVELYVKCSTFRLCLNECDLFHSNLMNCLITTFQKLETSNDSIILKYLELLLDLVFVYFYYNRKKDLNEIYIMMKNNLNKNYNLLMTYLNVTILSKAFKLNKLLLLNSFNKIESNEDPKSCISDDLNKLLSENKLRLKNNNHNQNNLEIKNDENYLKNEKIFSSSFSSNKSSIDNCNLFDYDADVEFSIKDNNFINDTIEMANLNDFSLFNSAFCLNNSKYRYDLILFPRILDICFNFLIQLRNNQLCDLNFINSAEDAHNFQAKYQKSSSIIQQFSKKILYLLESSNFNIQILINNNIRQYFIDILNANNCKPLHHLNCYNDNLNSYFKLEKQFLENCFDILYFICLYDMNESFLYQLFELMVNNNYNQYEIKSFSNYNHHIFLRNQSAKLLFKLSSNLQMIHSSCFLRMPLQIQQEPIDYLLETISAQKKWKINLNYEPTSPTSPNSNNISSSSEISKLRQQLNDSNLNQPNSLSHSGEPHLNRMIKESAHKICCLKIPLKLNQNSNSQLVSNHPTNNENNNQIKHSYSVAFMLRFDDNLINFSKSYGLTNSKNISSYESYAHIFSINLDNEFSSFEIWLNPNGNLLFIRRSDQSIIITFNLFQINSKIWHFLYVNYEEEQMRNINKLNCKISYSINASDLIEKEFEIFCPPNKPIARNATQLLTQNFYFYIGHQEKNSELNHLFNYDLGQVILSKNANYTTEHLLILMQIIDTNISLLDRLNSYEWQYLNGYVNTTTIDNLEKNFNEYCENLKSQIISIYNPKNVHVAAIKQSNNRTLNYIEVIASNSRLIQQTTFEIVLARIGGIRQILTLLAKLVEEENKLISLINSSKIEINGRNLEKIKKSDIFASLTILETLINLINMRPNIQSEFKQIDGYDLLQRIFTSIVSICKITSRSNNENYLNYFEIIKKKLFVVLLNGCFRKPIFCINLYSNDNLESCINLNTMKSKDKLKNSSIYLVNINLLSKVIIEWALWGSLKTNYQSESEISKNLWKYIFQTLNKLLENVNSSQLYHLNIFFSNNLHEKLIHFLLDANEENCPFDKDSCNSIISIFKNFNLIRLSMNNTTQLNSITKQLFANFFDYLNVLHPENRAYIVYSTKDFYFNLTINLPSIPFSSIQDVSKHSKNNNNKSPTSDIETETFSSNSDENTQSNIINRPALKKQIITLDRFQANQNDNNFSQISAGLMEIMYEMLINMPDSMINEILNLLKLESFIMLAMDENKDKRFAAFRIFLTLIERSSTVSFYITSSLATVATAAGVVANVATNPTSINSQTSFSRQFEQQSWSINKEYLIYAMCNQLNQYDQLDQRMAEFCIEILINHPFSFINMPDAEYLKSISSQIIHRINYIYLLTSLLYASRKNMKLCQNILNFIYILLETDIVKVDFLISKAGLLQVLINLLKFYSDESNCEIIKLYSNIKKIDDLKNKNGFELSIINDLKNLICLINRALLKFNENQDSDNYSYFINSFVSLCYDSSNIGYEKLNFNLKTIILNIVQSIMADLNSMSVIQEAAPKASILLKKIIAPLISTKFTESTTQIAHMPNISIPSLSSLGAAFLSSTSIQSSTPNSVSQSIHFTTVFDNDTRFQKFLIFIIDFIHIIYDKISDTAIKENTYDINDELAIFSFAILTHCISIGLDNTSKTKFSGLFKSNISFIRIQFRRLFIFMMHPNHKLQTRLQIIKRLLNSPNCELILKFILSFNDYQTSNVYTNIKLSFYLNALMNNGYFKQQTDLNASSYNNDKEILNHLNNILVNSGLNYKNELASYMNNLNKNGQITTDFSDMIEPTYLLVSNSFYSNINRRTAIDLMNQFDKELDDQRVNHIYKRSNDIFKHFLSQFDRLTNELNLYSINLLNQIVSMHSNVRKLYLLKLKNKRIEMYDIKQKWMRLIENMTHERCVYFDKNSSPNFYILDQTEGPNRERRRLKKSHLYIPERFFKQDYRNKLTNEKNATPLKYLLNNYEDFLTSSSHIDNTNYNSNSSGSSMGDYMLYHLKNSEVIKYPCSCRNVMPYCEMKGELLLTETRINFAADEKNYVYLMGIENVTYSWSYDDIKEIHLRRYLLKDVGLELFLIYGHTILLAFDDTRERNSIYKAITNKKLKNLIKIESIDEVTQLWRESKMSNYEYLMQLNKYSGRTFNDLMQYPVFPHILSNYSSETLDLADKENYRDLTKPVPIQFKEKEERFLQNYNTLLESTNEPYHYASLYSNSGTVLHYLVRLPPFTKMFLEYQDQNFDVPDRTFHSMNTSWLLSSSDSTTDYKELIPEFFFLHEFLTNTQGFNFGLRQNGEAIDNVVLPPWSKSNPRLFVSIMRQALESNYVTSNLNFWIDLIFGFKQSGKPALDAINLYHPACYFGYPVEQISDLVHRKAIETMIKTWGQTPKQIFTSNHPQSNTKKSNSISSNINNIASNSNINFNDINSSSIHRLILNIKWGSYVGSLEQQSPPVCIWKETCKKNIVSLVCLPTNEIIGLSHQKCLLSESRVRDNGTLNTALIEWGHYDDCVKVRVEMDKPSFNAVCLRPNEHTIVCVETIGSDYLIIGEKSGLLNVFKFSKKEKSNQIICDSFECYLFGHRQEITDINVCLSFSTMITSSQDGLLIIWDTNRLSYVNSIQLKNQFIYKVCISETTNDFAFIGNTPNKLYFYTGNCELIGERDTLSDSNKIDLNNSKESQNDNVINMKSLCFSNCTEGLNVNVIAVGLSNGRIRLYSTWDLTLLREISISFDSTNIGCIISLTYSKDGKRLVASDTYSRIYILEAANSPAALAKQQQHQLLASSVVSSNTTLVSGTNSSIYLTNLTCYT